MRTFIAVLLAADLRPALHHLLEECRRCDPHSKWVPVENLHFTLAFLGELSLPQLEQVKERCLETAARQTVFTIRFGQTGSFPPQGRPRVVWLGLERGGAEMAEAYRLLAAELASAGMPLEERPFVPHLTLGRARTGKTIAAWTQLQKLQLQESKPMPVTGLAVMRSQLQTAGPVYSLLQHCPFAPSSGL
ncbi:RNA 2',3'-cyclic phosphodiesterase [candidate division FCPU426 bacterium]|nr:RNA 2',3'-cyclic phosphodiesterase [candidate division FCPU426 bacterium]